MLNLNNQKLFNRLQNEIENQGWSINRQVFNMKEQQWELSQYSPAGEDYNCLVCFIEDEHNDITMENIKTAFKELWEDFDPEVHALMWATAENRGQPSLRVLLKDADDIKNMLEELYDIICEFIE